MSDTTAAGAPSKSEALAAARARRQLARVGLNATSIERFLKEIVDVDLHAKTILSLSLGTLGVRICPPDSTPPEARNFLAWSAEEPRAAGFIAQLGGGAAASEPAAVRAFFHAVGVIVTRSARVKVPRASRGSTSARYSAGLMSFRAQVASTE